MLRVAWLLVLFLFVFHVWQCFWRVNDGNPRIHNR